MNKSYFYLDMRTHELDVPFTGRKRRVRVLLPKGYAENTEETYPVVYFHDGQNVLYSKEAFQVIHGKSSQLLSVIQILQNDCSGY